MRKSLWMISVVTLITALGSTAAHADGLVVPNAGGYVAAIDGITLNGSLYNVTFTSTIDNTFDAFSAGSATLTAIQTAINTALNAYSTTSALNDSSGFNYGIEAGGEIAVSTTSSPSWIINSTVTESAFATHVNLVPTGAFYANFTSAVPELNPSTGTSAIVLLACAVLIIRGRRKITVAGN